MSSIKLWRDEKRTIINPTLFSEEAEELAKKLGNEAHGNLNKVSQLRRFFDEVICLKDQARTITDPDSEKWANLLPYVNMLIAKATYAQGRKLVSRSFVELLKDGISQIETPRDLNLFADFFEAFMGFYKVHGPN